MKIVINIFLAIKLDCSTVLFSCGIDIWTVATVWHETNVYAKKQMNGLMIFIIFAQNKNM